MVDKFSLHFKIQKLQNYYNKLVILTEKAIFDKVVDIKKPQNPDLPEPNRQFYCRFYKSKFVKLMFLL